jgi:hypothetical protein
LATAGPRARFPRPVPQRAHRRWCSQGWSHKPAASSQVPSERLRSWRISSPGPGRPGQRPRPNRRVRPRPGSLPNRPVGRRVHPDRQVRAVVFAFQQDRLVEHRSPLRGPRLRTSRSLVDHRRHARTR